MNAKNEEKAVPTNATDLTATIHIGDALYPLTDFKIEMKHDMRDITSLTGGYLRSALPVTTTVALTGILKSVPPDTEEEEPEEEEECEWCDGECSCSSDEDEDEWDDDNDWEEGDEWNEKNHAQWQDESVQYSAPIPLSGVYTPPQFPLNLLGIPAYCFNQLPQEPPKGDFPMPLLTQPTNTKSFRRDKAQLLVDALKERVQSIAGYCFRTYDDFSKSYTVVVEIPKEEEPNRSYITGSANPSKGTHIIDKGVLKIMSGEAVVALFPNGSLKEMIWMEDDELKAYVKAQIEKQEGEYRQKLTKELITKFSERLAKMGYHRWVLEHDYIVPAQKVPYSSLASYTPRIAMETYVAVSTEGQSMNEPVAYVRVGTMHELIAVSDEEFKKRVATVIQYRHQVIVGGLGSLNPAVSQKPTTLYTYVEKK